MTRDAFQSLKGQFLLAMPSLADPNFSGAVVYLCEHTEEGAMGLVINRPSPLMRSLDIFKEFGLDHVAAADAVPVYTGGPVQFDEIFLLHGLPFDSDDTFPVGGDIALSTSLETLAAVAKGVGPDKVAIFLGTAGWAAGQLEGELGGNAWLTVATGADLIFDVPVEDRWEKALDCLGIDPLLLSGDFGRA